MLYLAVQTEPTDFGTVLFPLSVAERTEIRSGPRQQSAAAALIALLKTHFECIIIKLKTYPVYSGT